MIAVVCTLLSAVAFYLSIGLGTHWWLLWIAPVPVLWLAFGECKPWVALAASWIAFALGASNLLRAYAGILPAAALAFWPIVPGLLFALAVIGSRQVRRAFGPISAMLAFAALWTAFDLIVSLVSAAGSIGSPATAEAAAPILVQSAALVGFCGVTFLIGAVAAGLALGARTRSLAPVAVAVALFAANAAYGYWRISTPPTASERIALIDSNDAVGPHQKPDGKSELATVDAYASQIEQLRGQHLQLIVLPENISRIDTPWRAAAEARLAAAANAAGATVVAGFSALVDGAPRNVAWAFRPGVSAPTTYEKRHLIPVLESSVFKPGPGPVVLPDGTALEICLDMDYQRMLRHDATTTRPKLLAVPAWDFGADGWFHARDAVMRSVENGVPMARSARDGLMTLNDRFGRLVAEAPTVAGFTSLVGELPLAGRGGATLYDRTGDAFGWLCLLMGTSLVGASLRHKLPKRQRGRTNPIGACIVVGALLMGLSPPPTMAKDAAGPPYKVGITHRRFAVPKSYDWRNAETHALLATIWYPAAANANEAPQWIGTGGAPLALAGRAAPDAGLAPAPTGFPLVVISHGTGGSASAMAWLGTRLAARGYIAVAVNHPGNNALEPYTVRGFTLWWERAADLSQAIDEMLADPRLGPHIDAQRIGAAGFSLGGYTMIEIAGGRSSSAFFDLCNRHPENGKCTSPPEFPDLVPKAVALLRSDPGYRAAVAGAGGDYRDRRVRAVFAIAPALESVFLPESLRSISIPVEIVAGSADAIEPVAANAKRFAAHIPGSRLVLFPGAGHYTFFATCTAAGKKAQPGLCTDPPGIDRHRVHERAADLAAAFFSAHLTQLRVPPPLLRVPLPSQPRIPRLSRQRSRP
jgi:apolipoprotein N-acyltransferase